ncbi:hypothetical protein F5Y14DRAFT_256899 [Nemania sp. NC0429]|nr:hypothetical protein F5Y14DRAFT_256899 [Nemania sp. NC0429]
MFHSRYMQFRLVPVVLATQFILGKFECLATKNVVDKSGHTLLHWAAQSGNVDIFTCVLSSEDVDINEPDADGWTALCWAARCPTLGPAKIGNFRDWKELANTQTDMIKCLLNHGAKMSVRVRSHDGGRKWTPEAIAAFHAMPEAVVDLLAKEDSKSRFPGPQGAGHMNIRCDCCQSYIFGTRYKCKNILNFDLCFKCHWHHEDLVEGWEVSSFEFEIIESAVDDAASTDDEDSTSSWPSEYV